jgi:hypothetical protein
MQAYIRKIIQNGILNELPQNTRSVGTPFELQLSTLYAILGREKTHPFSSINLNRLKDIRDPLEKSNPAKEDLRQPSGPSEQNCNARPPRVLRFAKQNVDSAEWKAVEEARQERARRLQFLIKRKLDEMDYALEPDESHEIRRLALVDSLNRSIRMYGEPGQK